MQKELKKFLYYIKLRMVTSAGHKILKNDKKSYLKHSLFKDNNHFQYNNKNCF